MANGLKIGSPPTGPMEGRYKREQASLVTGW
jgi:hypothetical protein